MQALCHGKYRPDARERLLFGGILICGECGQAYSHIQSKGRYRNRGVAKWKCRNYLYRNRLSCAGGFITDKEAMDVCVEAINWVIEDKDLLVAANDVADRVSPRYRELDRKLRQMVTDENADPPEDITSLFYESAAERFKTLEVKDTEQNTREMLHILEGKEKLEHFDEELYRKLIKQMIVYKDSTVKVIFHNGISTKVGYGNGVSHRGYKSEEKRRKIKNRQDMA